MFNFGSSDAHSMILSARIRIVGGIVKFSGLGRLEINDKLELGRLLDGDVGRLPAFEDEVDNLSAAPPLLAMIGAVGHKAAGLRELAVAVDSGQVQTEGDRGNFGPLT